MILRLSLVLILSLFIASCGGAAPTEMPFVLEEPVATEPPAVTEAPTQPALADTAIPAPTQTLRPASTATQTPAVTQTETELPPLELPTEALNAPARMVWDGTPTYLGDSTPGFAFRVTYDPDLWAVTTDQFGFPALGHRSIEYCVIAVTAGRGLPANIVVEHDVLYTGTVTFDVGIAFENGVRKFATYTGGNGTILTAFEVSFQDQADACLADAVTVLSTLQAVPASQATPWP